MRKKYVLKSPGRKAALAAAVLAVLAAILVWLAGTETQNIPGMQVFNVIFGHGGAPLQDPSAVTVGLKGEVIVADSGSKRIMVFADNGEYLYSFSGPGTGLAELEQPVALAVGPDGNIYVADRSKEAVIVFSDSGEYRYRITGPEGFIPSGVVVAEDGVPVIFNEADMNLYAYDRETKGLQSVFGNTKKKSQPILMGEMFWDPDSEKIFAVDREGKQVAVITKDGVQDTWGRDYLGSPCGIAYDRSNDLVFVSDTAGSRIVVFNSEGDYAGELGSMGDGKEDFNSPGGLAMDQRGRLYVADRGNNRVVIYRFK